MAMGCSPPIRGMSSHWNVRYLSSLQGLWLMQAAPGTCQLLTSLFIVFLEHLIWGVVVLDLRVVSAGKQVSVLSHLV